MKREALKSLALKAKNRMIHKKEIGFDIQDRDVNVKVISGKDELFYDKVRRILESDEDVTNPIKILMDESLFLRLDPRGKEKYLLETVEKYHRFKKQFEEERLVRESV